MAELKLFKVNGHVEELKSKSVTIEKELQNIIEKNMQIGKDGKNKKKEFLSK